MTAKEARGRAAPFMGNGGRGLSAFERHLRAQRLGEFTIGTAPHRSDSLALVQLLILYHLVTACAAVALGGGRQSRV